MRLPTENYHPDEVRRIQSWNNCRDRTYFRCTFININDLCKTAHLPCFCYWQVFKTLHSGLGFWQTTSSSPYSCWPEPQFEKVFVLGIKIWFIWQKHPVCLSLTPITQTYLSLQKLSTEMLDDQVAFFEALSRFQENRLNDQRCSIEVGNSVIVSLIQWDVKANLLDNDWQCI